MPYTKKHITKPNIMASLSVFARPGKHRNLDHRMSGKLRPIPHTAPRRCWQIHQRTWKNPAWKSRNMKHIETSQQNNMVVAWYRSIILHSSLHQHTPLVLWSLPDLCTQGIETISWWVQDEENIETIQLSKCQQLVDCLVLYLSLDL